MPTERFFNLPEEKRRRTLDVAIKEMTDSPIESLSINRIIQAADIPRGSFYQYFTDKNDLVEYILTDFKRLLTQKLKALSQEENSDLFTVFYELLEKTVEYGTRENHCMFFKNTVAHIFTNSKFSQCCHFFEPKDFIKECSPFLTVEKYRYSDESSLIAITEILFILVRDTAIRIFNDPESKTDEEIEAVKRKFEMIKNGILLPGKESANV